MQTRNSVAENCINLPRYSSAAVMKTKLLYAINNCLEMDADFRLAGNEVTGTGLPPEDVQAFEKVRRSTPFTKKIVESNLHVKLMCSLRPRVNMTAVINGCHG